MSKKIFSIMTLFAFVLVLASGVNALSLMAVWDNQQSFKQINPGESTGYWVAVVNDQGFEYTDVTIKIYDKTTGNLSYLSTLFSHRTYQLFYYPDMFTLTAQQYTNQPGDYMIEVVAAERLNGATITRSEQIYLDVLGNRPPRVDFTYNPTNPTTDDTITFVASGTDDDGAIVSYQWDFTNDGTFDASGETTTHRYTVAGIYSARVRVTDNEGATAEKIKQIVVNQGAPINQPPVIVPIPDQQINENNFYQYQVQASDPNNDPITCSLSQSPGWLTINPNTCLISGTTPEVNQNTTFSITVIVSDGQLSVSDTYDLKVVNVLPANQPPVIVIPGYTTINENTFYEHTFQVSDPNNDPLNCYAINIPSWLYLSGTNNCKISGTSPEVNQNTEYVVTVGVSDGQLTSQGTYTILVKNVVPTNQPPVSAFTYSPANPQAGQTVTFDGSNSYDSDGTIVSYEWKVNNQIIGYGQVIGYAFQNAGTYTVQLKVTDNQGSSDTEAKTIVVGQVPTLIIDELGCNANVVQGHQQHCSAHVQNNIPGATIKFRYSGTNELLGTCDTNAWGYCHINPVINKPIGIYEVYATAEKAGYNPDNSMLLRTTFRVWAERYEIQNLKTWEDEFITENYTFYRANPVYSSFDVYDMFTNQYVPPGSGLVEHVFLRVNNADPLNFTSIGTFQLTQIQDIQVVDDSSRISGTTSVGMYKFLLPQIPITDDYLGEGKVFVFVLNYSDGTAGQDSVNVLILNNELIFNQPSPYYIQSGQTINIDFADFVSDIETPNNEMVMSVGDFWPFSVVKTGNLMFKVTSPENFEGQHNILFTADDTDGSVVTRNVLFIVSQNPNVPPVAQITYVPLNPFVNDTVTFTSTSYDSDGQIVSYLWKINGVPVSNQNIFNHIFPVAGTYTVDLTVTDDDGAHATATKQVVVKNKSVSNMPPVASFTYSPVPAHINEPTTFISTSYDLDGEIVSYEWIIEEVVVSNSASFTHIFVVEGSYMVELKVTDNNGATARTRQEIRAIKNPLLGAPIAILDAPGSAIINSPVILDASRSYDPDGYIVEYRWVVKNNNVIVDSFTTTNPKISYVFKNRYVNIVELTVVDNDKKTGSTSARVDVGKENSAPIMTHGSDDGLFIDYIEIYGTDRDTLGIDEPFTVSVTVTNDRGEGLDDVYIFLKLPEIGYTIKSHKQSLKAGETRNFVIQDYLPFLPQDIDPGEYIAIVGASGDGVTRTKYYPLIIR